MNPSYKDPEINAFIKQTTGIDRVKCIEENKCTICKAEVDVRQFRDTLSVKEYGISGMCQACQDSVFGESEPYDDNYGDDYGEYDEPAF